MDQTVIIGFRDITAAAGAQAIDRVDRGCLAVGERILVGKLQDCGRWLAISSVLETLDGDACIRLSAVERGGDDRVGLRLNAVNIWSHAAGSVDDEGQIGFERQATLSQIEILRPVELKGFDVL